MNKEKKSKISVISLVLMLLCVSFMAILQTNAANTTDYENLLQYEWPVAGADAGRTHFSAGPAPNSPDILWKKAMPTINFMSPVAFNGNLFVGQGSNLLALDPFTSEIVYNVTVPSIPDRICTIMNIFKIDDTQIGVVIGSSGSYPTTSSLWALRIHNIADGSNLWSDPDPKVASLRSGLLNCANYVEEEKMLYVAVGNETGRGSFAAGSSGKILAWDISDPRSPSLKWTYLSDGVIGDWGTNFVYGEGKLWPDGSAHHQPCLDAKTGQILWDTELTGIRTYQGTYYEGKLLRGLLDNTFVALDAKTGQILWSFNPGTYGFWCSGTSAAYGMVYCTNVDGNTYALDVETGEVIWTHWAGGLYYPGHIQIADGKVYVCTSQANPSPITPESSHSEYSCLDAYTGKVIWKVQGLEFTAGPIDTTCIAYGNFYGFSHIYYGGNGDFICYGSPKDWTNFLGDSTHNAVGYGGPTDPALLWEFKTNGAVISSPAIVDGKVYIGSYDKNWYCLDARTGAKIWNFTSEYRIRSSPAVANGKVYTGADDGYVYCLDADTGQKIWEAPTPGYWIHILTGTTVEYRGSPIVVGNNVYVGALDGKIYCLNANTGNIIWSLQTTGAIISTPTHIAGDGLYFTSVDGYVYKLNPETGNIIWNASTPIGIEISMMGSPAVGDGKVFIGSGAAGGSPAGIGQFYCLNATTGDFIWTVDQLPGSGQLQPIWSMLYLEGKVFHGDFFSFDCRNATNGDLIWSTFLTREHYGSPAYADGKFYVPSDSYGIYVIDAETGDKLSYFRTGPVQSSPAIYEGKVYFGSCDWSVYCLEESSVGTTYYSSQDQSLVSDQQLELKEAAEPETSIEQEEPETPETPTDPEEPQTPTEPEETATESALITTETAITAVVAIAAIIGAVSLYVIRKRK
ncbi:MAG: PQQ-binding-like beta-propeller repeat protein [Candidatus Bathyarchaeota archaeon]|nr:PQQ-binding-like beta-propeller repeat protein [Candidatus Bathyarchaeum sp.]